jgi:hypothetical protein
METKEALKKLIEEKLKNMTPEQIKMMASAAKHVKAKHKKKKKS